MKTNLLVLCLGVCASVAAAANPEEARSGRPDLVAKVAAGELREARASWWGFDAEDSTRALQAALASGVPRLIVDKTPSPWVTLPLKGASNQTLVFEDGAEIRAKRGAYLGKGDCLLTYDQKVNVTLEGAGTLRMWHADYLSAPYEPAEWRHALCFLSCSNVVVKGLSLVDSGGDGIYLGARGPVRKNTDVTIRDVVCKDNHRQGISVISAENLLIENTQLLTTHGTAPQAGIDFEPNHPTEVLKNCVMRNCRAEGNSGAGYATWVGQLTPTSEPVDLRFENCTSTGDRGSFFYGGRAGAEVGGRVTLVGCRFVRPTKGAPVDIRENRATPFAVVVADSCIVTNSVDGVEVVVPMDAAWMQENLPILCDPDGFLPRGPRPDLSKAVVKDARPDEMLSLSPLRVRGAAAYCVYADRARPLRFRGRQISVGRYPLSTKSIQVANAAGTVLKQFPMPGKETVDFAFEAPEKGFYSLKVDPGQGAFLLMAADCPVAVDATAQAVGFIASEGDFWVTVPKGTPRFFFEPEGEGAERVTVSLVDPSGAVAWSQQDLARRVRAKIKGPASGLWRVKIARPSAGCFEDSQYDFVGIPGHFFLTADRTW